VTDERPTNPSDYAALSAGWGALMGALLVAARDKGEEPVRAAETLPLGLATFALAKMVSKEKVDAWVREPFVEETQRRAVAAVGIYSGCRMTGRLAAAASSRRRTGVV
jgi:hypothetical protein